MTTRLSSTPTPHRNERTPSQRPRRHSFAPFLSHPREPQSRQNRATRNANSTHPYPPHLPPAGPRAAVHPRFPASTKSSGDGQRAPGRTCVHTAMEQKRRAAISFIAARRGTMVPFSLRDAEHQDEGGAGEVSVQEAQQGMVVLVLQLAKGFRFDLPDAFPRDLQPLADFLQRVLLTVQEAVAEFQHEGFAFVQG